MVTLFGWVGSVVSSLWSAMYSFMVYTYLDLANMIFIIVIIGLLLYLFRRLVLNG